MRKIVGICLALVLLPSVAKASELVANGGFETGSYSSWTQGGNLGFTGVTSSAPYVHSGTFGSQMGPVGSNGTLSQTLTTVAAASYRFSFWVYNDGGTPNSFDALWNGVSVGAPFPFINGPPQAYTEYTFFVTATGAASTIQFSFRQDPAWWGLDDVSVVDVPVPAGAALAGIGMLCIGGFAYRRRQRALRA